MEILIKYHADIKPIEKQPYGDWIDLRAAEDCFIPLGEYKLISLGVSMMLPAGYEAQIIPRSSTFKHFGIIMVNSMGLIDNTYCGNRDIWHFPAYCLKWKQIMGGEKGTAIFRNDRIAQFRIVENQPRFDFRIVEELPRDNRGGFGSTGVR